MIKLGHAFNSVDIFLKPLEMLDLLLEISNEAIEISLTSVHRFAHEFSSEELELIKKFKYISLHAPVVEYSEARDSKIFLNYPDKKYDWVIDKIKKLDEVLDVDTILFHPDQIKNFDWVNSEFPEKLAFENIDADKKFGKSVSDLKQVFEKSPHAKWVCDVNHIYTIDKSMQLSNSFHREFKNRLCHYHISAFNGFHDAFCKNPNEKIILSGVKNLNLPLIHEGNATKKDKNFLQKEDKFVRDCFKNNL